MENKLDKKVELDEVKALIQENKESAATGGRFFIAFSSQGGQYQCRSDRLVSSLYSVLLNLTQERQKCFHNIHTLAPLLYPR
jgi:hypothetical protein